MQLFSSPKTEDSDKVKFMKITILHQQERLVLFTYIRHLPLFRIEREKLLNNSLQRELDLIKTTQKQTSSKSVEGKEEAFIEDHLDYLKKTVNARSSNLYSSLFKKSKAAIASNLKGLNGLTIKKIELPLYNTLISKILDAFDTDSQDRSDFNTATIFSTVMNWKRDANPPMERTRSILCPRWWTANAFLSYHLSNNCNNTLKVKKGLLLLEYLCFNRVNIKLNAACGSRVKLYFFNVLS